MVLQRFGGADRYGQTRRALIPATQAYGAGVEGPFRIPEFQSNGARNRVLGSRQAIQGFLGELEAARGGPSASAAAGDPLGSVTDPVRRLDRSAQRPLRARNEQIERRYAPEEDPVVQLLGPEYAIPEDLGWLDYSARDPREKAKSRAKPQPMRGRKQQGGPAAYAVVDLPAVSTEGKWRDASGQRLVARLDPAAPTEIKEYKDPDTGDWLPQGRGIDYRDEGYEVRDLTLGQAARRFSEEARTPMVDSETLEFLMSPEGGQRFMPAPEDNPQGVLGWLRQSSLRREGRGQVRTEYEMVPVYPTTSVTRPQTIKDPSGRLRQVGGGLPLARVGAKYGVDADEVSAQLRPLLAGTRSLATDVTKSAQADRSLTRITPVHLKAAIERGFEVGEPSPGSGVMSFRRPDGSEGLLIPEQILAAGNRPTGKTTPRFIVVDGTGANTGSLPVIPAVFAGAGRRSFIEKQADLNPDGVNYWSAIADLGAAGGTEPAQVQGKELVARVLRDRGLTPADLSIASPSQLADLQDAARAVANRPWDSWIPGLTRNTAPSVDGEPSLAALGRTPQQRVLDALYASPSMPLPGSGLPNPVSLSAAAVEPAGIYPAAGGARVPTADFADAPFWGTVAAQTPALENAGVRLTPAGVTTVQDSVMRRLFQAEEGWPGGRIARGGPEAVQTELPIAVAAAPEPAPAPSSGAIPRAGWDALREDDTEGYVSGYNLVRPSESNPAAAPLEALIPLAKRFTFGDEKQAALITDVALRTAEPGPDGRIGPEQVIGRLMEIANPPVATGSRARYATPAEPRVFGGQDWNTWETPTGQIESESFNWYRTPPTTPVARDRLGGELSPVAWKRAVAGPAPVAQLAAPAGELAAAADAFRGAVGASVATPVGQRWIPGLPSADAAYRVNRDPEFERAVADLARRGRSAQNAERLRQFAPDAAALAGTPAERLKRVLGSEAQYQAAPMAGYRGRTWVEQLGLPGWPSVFSS